MYPISDLTAFCRKTTGDVPPKLVVSARCYVLPEAPLHARARTGRIHHRRGLQDVPLCECTGFARDCIL